jgi:cytochrome P450
LKSIEIENNEVAQALDCIFIPSFGFFLIPYWHLLPLELNRRRDRSIKLLQGIVFDMINQRKKLKAEGKPSPSRDFLQIMLDEGSEHFSDQDFFDECITMFLGNFINL